MDELKQEIAALKQTTEAQEAKIKELEATVAAKEVALAELETVKMVDDAIAAKKLPPAQRETAIHMAKQSKETFDKFVAATAMADITQPVDVPEAKEGDATADPKSEYKKLMQNPTDLLKFKNENPEGFEKMRKAYYNGGK